MAELLALKLDSLYLYTQYTESILLSVLERII